MGYNQVMTYEIRTTKEFDSWLENLRDRKTVFRIAARLDRVEQGNFGDVKNIDETLSEMRFFFGSGYRIYYTMEGEVVVLLLNGGDKSSQKKDIKKAYSILESLKGEDDE